MPGLKTFDPKKVIVTFGGVPITGFTDGTFVQIAPATDAFTKKVGADSEVARSRSNDDTSGVTLTLMQTSDSNAYLKKIETQDKLLGTGVLPLSITNLMDPDDSHFWPQAWIKKDPNRDYNKEVGDRAWEFDTGQPA